MTPPPPPRSILAAVVITMQGCALVALIGWNAVSSVAIHRQSAEIEALKRTVDQQGTTAIHAKVEIEDLTDKVKRLESMRDTEE